MQVRVCGKDRLHQSYAYLACKSAGQPWGRAVWDVNDGIEGIFFDTGRQSGLSGVAVGGEF